MNGLAQKTFHEMLHEPEIVNQKSPILLFYFSDLFNNPKAD